MNITDVNAKVKACKNKHRVGRGAASGSGKTSGRGQTGAGSRAGESALRGFIGGQSPLRQRLPKRGFNNVVFKTQYCPVNLSWLDANFADGAVAGVEEMVSAGVNLRRGVLIKVLGTGDISKKITVKAHAFSKSAVEKIEKAGGKTEVIPVVSEKAPKSE